VNVESSASDAEDSDVEMSPSKPVQKVVKTKKKTNPKLKKRDGWIWLESLTRKQALGDEKLVAYKKESEWHCIFIGYAAVY
jgi:hypothetical protein